ncbi:MAG: SusC/RagA family TonB-linked outer membrane protein [Bacteroidota bacterium]|jgi:TonB-linked SusC/RagA family outer membrane protein
MARKQYSVLVWLLLLMLPAGIRAQELSISGAVKDAGSKETLPGVTVTIKGTTRGTLTGADGTYTIKAQGTDVLVFQVVGLERQEIPVEGRTLIDVLLGESTSLLSDVVVVGYGVQKKSQITGAIASISNKDFKDQPVSNLAGSIQGRVSGLNVTTPSGTPGAGLLVNVRGNLNPLYVVDGIPMLSESNSSLSTAFNLQGESVGSGQTLSSVSDINPNDIESIEILKDASAAAIYGARAANGVVLITTKRGKEGKTEVNFNAYTGMQQAARKIKFMDAGQFVDLIEEARRNDLAIYNSDNSAFGEDFDPSVLTEPLDNFNLDESANTIWLDEVTRTAPISNYELSMRGGDARTRFFTAMSYFDQTGVVIENYYKRLNLRLNLDHHITDKFTVGLNLSNTFSRNRRSFNDDTYTGVITNAIGASPLMPVYEEDGSYSAFENYQASWLSDNPVKSAKEIRAFTNNYRVLATAYGEYAFRPNLRFRSSFSTDAAFLFDNQFKSALTADAAAVGGEAYEAGFRAITWLNENTLTYTKTSGKNNLTILGGITEQRTQLERNSITGQGFPPSGLEKISSAANIVGASSSGTSFSLLSFLSRVNYAYNDRYLFTATMRADGSSRFSKDNRFGYFPSASAAWRISSEDFFNRNFFTDLKMRLSYGITGDQEIGDFENVSFYSAANYDNQAGIAIRNIADPALSWQSNRMLNVGLDYEIKGGRFNGSLEFFKSNKTRLLSRDAIPGTTGFATVTRNSGEVQNTGVEGNLTAYLRRGGDFNWTLNVNGTYVKNEIRSLSSDEIYLNAFSDLEASHILKVGEPIGSFVGLNFTGIDPQTGDATYEDTNGDGIIDYDDAQIIGKALPTFFGGVTNKFSYKNWDLSIFARFTGGNQVYNLMRATSDNLGYSNDGGLSSVYANNRADLVNRWRKPGDIAEYGRASFINPNFFINSSQFLENGAFVRIQNVNLSYTFPKIGKFSNMMVYLEGQNLWLFSQYKGFDPEVSSNGASTDRTAGIDYGAYPQARTITLGVNLKL